MMMSDKKVESGIFAPLWGGTKREHVQRREKKRHARNRRQSAASALGWRCVRADLLAVVVVVAHKRERESQNCWVSGQYKKLRISSSAADR